VSERGKHFKKSKPPLHNKIQRSLQNFYRKIVYCYGLCSEWWFAESNKEVPIKFQRRTDFEVALLDFLGDGIRAW